MTYYEVFQLEHYGDVIPPDGGAELESGRNEAAAFEYWMRNGEESLLHEMGEGRV